MVFLVFGSFFLHLIVLFDFHAAGVVHGAELAEAALAERTVAFELGLGFHGETGPGNRGQTGLGNLLGGQFADAVGVSLDALEGLLNFVNGVLVGGKQAEGEVAVEIVRAGIGHVQAVAGHFLRGVLGEAAHLVEEPVAEVEQVLVIFHPLGLDFDGCTAAGHGLGGRDAAQNRGGRGRLERFALGGGDAFFN